MAKRTYQAIDKTIDGLKISEFDEASNLIAQPFNENNEYGVGRYVSFEGDIYQKIVETERINLLNQPYVTQINGNPYTSNGITWSVNSGGGIVANGTATADSYYSLYQDIIYEYMDAEEYTLSGCPESGSSSEYYLLAHFILPPSAEIDGGAMSTWNTGDTANDGTMSPWTYTPTTEGVSLASWENYFDEFDFGNGNTFEMPQDQLITGLEISCVIKAGNSVSNLIFYPQFQKDGAIDYYQQPNKLVEPWVEEHWQYVEPDELGITTRPPQIII